MDNLSIYNQSREVPKEAQKQFSNGRFSGTDINPMWRIKKLTELFGVCGVGWYYTIDRQWTERGTNDTQMAFTNISLYIKIGDEWSKPIHGTGGNSLIDSTKNGLKNNDEGFKMSLTDALSVAAKAIGIGADIYFSSDRTKYDVQGKDAVTQKDDDNLIIAIDEAKRSQSVESLEVVWESWECFQKDVKFQNVVRIRKQELLK